MAKIKSIRISPRLINLTGHKYGKLTVLGRGPNIGPIAAWSCVCDCGNLTLVNGSSLRGGRSFSCGCNRIAAGRKRVIGMVGKKFTRLTVLCFDRSNAEGKAMWRCLCDCGQTTVVIGKELRSGHTHSCGCWRRDVTGDCARTHGMTGTSEHKAWKAAKGRCTNPADESYEHYGGRGITMCAEWMDSFELFYAHIGPRPPRLTLDRIDNDKGYEPGNVRWATGVQQAANRRPRRWWRKPQSS